MTRAAALGSATLFAFVAACGGGGGGGGPVEEPPATVSYATTVAVYETEEPIAPNAATTTGGTPDHFTISPALPAGLQFDPATGAIDGTPTAVDAESDYAVFAVNAGGSAGTTISIEVILNKTLDLSPKSTFTDDDVRFFLGRTHFGGTGPEFTNVQSMGVPAYVDQMVEYGPTPTLDATATTYLYNVGDPVGLEGGFPNHSQVAAYWLYLMTNNPNPFQEVMAFFWHDHFASSTAPLEGGLYWSPMQTQLWRTKGNGNLRTLLLDMARDWLMLKWLDGVINTAQAPNENFAREWFELFTLGVDNDYVQADIVQAAKAWTGYRERFNNTTGQNFVEFDFNRHDHSQKTVLGVVIPAQPSGPSETDDYDEMVDLTLAFRGSENTPQVAQFISKKLFEYFAYAPAPQSVVDSMAATLVNAGYELKPLFRTLFQSEAFFSWKSKAGIPKNPVEHIVGFIRSTGLVPVDPKNMNDPPAGPSNKLNTLVGSLANATQLPTQPPTVNGWPIGSQWLSAQNAVDRANAILSCIRDRTDQTNAGIDVAAILPPVAERTADNVVDALTALLHVAPTADERTKYVTYLNSTAGAGGVPSPSPFDGSNPAHLSERVRGLLYMLTQHPTFGVR